MPGFYWSMLLYTEYYRPTVFQNWHLNNPNTGMMYFPFAWLPSAIVPLEACFAPGMYPVGAQEGIKNPPDWRDRNHFMVRHLFYFQLKEALPVQKSFQFILTGAYRWNQIVANIQGEIIGDMRDDTVEAEDHLAGISFCTVSLFLVNENSMFFLLKIGREVDEFATTAELSNALAFSQGKPVFLQSSWISGSKVNTNGDSVIIISMPFLDIFSVLQTLKPIHIHNAVHWWIPIIESACAPVAGRFGLMKITGSSGTAFPTLLHDQHSFFQYKLSS